MKQDTPFDALVEQAMQEALSFAVGEVQPRLVPTSAGELIHELPLHTDRGTRLLRCLLVDVGWPEGLVCTPIRTDSQGRYGLDTPHLWPYRSPVATPDARPIGYTMLFEEHRQRLHATS